MQYDISSKVLIEKCHRAILNNWLGLSIKESEFIEEVPQETASVRRSDFAVIVTDETGSFFKKE